MEYGTLCFDFGNTRLKCGVFKKGQIDKVVVLPDDSDETIQKIIDTYAPAKTILSSVIEHNPGVDKILGARSLFHRISSRSQLPFTTPVNKPESIGADRIALSAGAVHFYPGVNNLVIGMGSCITYNFINKYREFMGGGISPGMEMRFTSLKVFTAKLPLVKPDWNFPLIGYNTRTNILSGILLGMCYEMDGMIDAYGEKYGNFNVLLTGGDALFFAAHLKSKIFADPDLIFKGLYAISEYNDDTKT